MQINAPKKLLAIGLGLVLMVTFWLPPSGKAQGIIYGDSIQSGQVVDQNLLMNGTDVTIDGTVNGDVLAFGRTVTVNGIINGSLLVVGETIIINGQVSGNIVAGGVRIEMGKEGKVQRDLCFVGARLTLPDGSVIQRDLHSLVLEAQLSGTVERDINAIIGPLKIAQLIFGPIKDRITIIGSKNSNESWVVAQSHAPKLTGRAAGALVPAVFWLTENYSHNQQTAQIDTDRLKLWAVKLLENMVALLLVGLLGSWLVPGPLNWASEKLQQSLWGMAFSGLAIFLGGWFFAIIALTLILTLALFFYSISLPNLGFLLGAFGIFGVGLGITVFWLAITYVSKVLVANLVGRLLLQRFGPQYLRSNLWPMLLGIVLYTLVASIPYLGWIVATVFTFLGLGALWVVSFPSTSQQQGSGSLPALAHAD